MMNLESNEMFQKLVENIENAPVENKSEVIMESVRALFEEQSKGIVEQYRVASQEVESDANNAKKFGLRKLNKEENKFYDSIKVKQALSADEVAYLPTTTANHIFEDMKESSGLLSHVRLQPAGLTQILSSEYTGSAVWGELTDAIVAEITPQIKAELLSAKKLSAFLLVPTAILDMGNEWVDRYVRQVLQEVIEDAVEKEVLIGDGAKGPIGLNRKLTGAVDGVYPARVATALTAFDPATYGAALAPLTNGGKRKVDKVILAVNPTDYLTKVMSASKALVNGVWVDVFPFPTVVVQSIHVPSGQAIAFLDQKYDLGLNRLAIENSDHYKFLEHQRTYRAVAYGNGKLPKEDMAVLFDISGLTSYVQPVTVKGTVSTKEVV